MPRQRKTLTIIPKRPDPLAFTTAVGLALPCMRKSLAKRDPDLSGFVGDDSIYEVQHENAQFRINVFEALATRQTSSYPQLKCGVDAYTSQND